MTTKNKARIKAKATDYVNNQDMWKSLHEYRQAYFSAKVEGRELPRIPEYLGECIKKIAEGLAARRNFNGYSFKDEMVYDGIFDCIKYLHNFNTDKYDSPFAYFNRIIWQAFVRRIEKEKKNQYVKMKLQEQADIFGEQVSKKRGDDSSEREFQDFHNRLEEKFGKR